jgi:hypothetical protein
MAYYRCTNCGRPGWSDQPDPNLRCAHCRQPAQLLDSDQPVPAEYRQVPTGQIQPDPTPAPDPGSVPFSYGWPGPGQAGLGPPETYYPALAPVRSDPSLQLLTMASGTRPIRPVLIQVRPEPGQLVQTLPDLPPGRVLSVSWLGPNTDPRAGWLVLVLIELAERGP